MKIGFTGTTWGITVKQFDELVNLILELNPDEYHHGDAIGADETFHDICMSLEQEGKLEALGIIHPPKNSKKRAFKSGLLRDTKEYLDRNHDIVDETDVLIACPKGMIEELRSGTWATVRYARKRGKQIYIIWPE